MDLKVGRFTGQALQDLLGKRVARAAANLPQTATGSLFLVTGGRVLLNGIFGEVTTAIQAQANATKLVSTPTVGTVGDLCATLDINGKELGTLLGITGLSTDAMVGVNANSTPWMYQRRVVPIGAIGLSCAASNTGTIKWVCFFTPLDPGATLVAA